GGPAVHEQENRALGLGRKMGRLGRERIGGPLRVWLRSDAVAGQQGSQRQAGKAAAGLPEELAASAVAEGVLGSRFVVHMADTPNLSLDKIVLCCEAAEFTNAPERFDAFP